MKDFACLDLTGKTISGWSVGNKIDNKDTTAKYSLFYEVTKEGQQAIMKVLNYEQCHNGPLDGAKDRDSLISRETSAFHFESELAEACTGNHMGNVIRYLERGTIEIQDYVIKTVSYIIYEMSEGTISEFLDFSTKSSFVANLGVLVDKLKSLHQVAKGVKQLHTHLIAHHNITPQSVEVFEGNSLYKIGGLQKSRTSQAVLHTPVAAKLFDGDYTFAPPEAYFNYKLSEEMDTYFQIDTYMLGNLIVYYLTNMNLTTLIDQKCPNTLLDWASKGSKYPEVLPDIIKAFNETMDEIEMAICDKELRQDIIEIIEGLCHPDPVQRGYPRGLCKVQANADLQRVLTKLDILYKKAKRTLYLKKP